MESSKHPSSCECVCLWLRCACVVDVALQRPVGTQGTIKGLTPQQVEQCGPAIILGNTYHLGIRPGADLIAEMGGLHSFMKWNR